LRKLEALCTSGQCVGNSREDLAAWQQPILIQFTGCPDGWRGGVAQYSGLATIGALEAKLAQFPRGTRFRVVAGQADPATVERLLRFGSARGLTIVRQ